MRAEMSYGLLSEVEGFPRGYDDYVASATIGGTVTATLTPTAPRYNRLYLSDIVVTNQAGGTVTVTFVEPATGNTLVIVSTQPTYQLSFRKAYPYRSGTVVASASATVVVTVNGGQF